MVEIKARLYDIQQELQELKSQRELLIKTIKEKTYQLDPNLFLPSIMATSAEISHLTGQLLENIHKTQKLTEEQTNLKQKLEAVQ